ncbi:hypothetical protein LJC48_01225 [Desulfovibrio sp. OttesenSCG-928-C06]|nr:hypothetical protein [Desulfovibrio sp. OttesenSCG-928-C06]
MRNVAMFLPALPPVPEPGKQLGCELFASAYGAPSPEFVQAFTTEAITRMSAIWDALSLLDPNLSLHFENPSAPVHRIITLGGRHEHSL